MIHPIFRKSLLISVLLCFLGLSSPGTDIGNQANQKLGQIKNTSKLSRSEVIHAWIRGKGYLVRPKDCYEHHNNFGQVFWLFGLAK